MFVRVPGDGVDDLGALVVPPGQVGADLGVSALDLVVHSLADIVQQAGAPRELAVQAQFLPALLEQVLVQEVQVRMAHRRVLQFYCHFLEIDGPVEHAHGHLPLGV